MKVYSLRINEETMTRFKKLATTNKKLHSELFDEMLDVYENKKNEIEALEERIGSLESEMRRLQALMTFNYEYTILLVKSSAELQDIKSHGEKEMSKYVNGASVYRRYLYRKLGMHEDGSIIESDHDEDSNTNDLEQAIGKDIPGNKES